MKFLKVIWVWLNGNKTLFGMIIMYFVDKPGDLFGIAMVELFAAWLGGILLGGGVVHKVLKGTKNT